LVQMFIHKKVKPNSWNSWLSIMRLTSEWTQVIMSFS
jgi:hypothetical protein